MFPAPSLRLSVSASDLSVVPEDGRALKPHDRGVYRQPESSASQRRLSESVTSAHRHRLSALHHFDQSAGMATGVLTGQTLQKTRNTLDDLQGKRSSEPQHTKSFGRRDKDLSAVQARDWGVTYADTHHLMAILDHYFLWDHYTYHFFDEDAFWEGLAAGGSEFCNKLLVQSIVAFTAVQRLHAALTK